MHSLVEQLLNRFDDPVSDVGQGSSTSPTSASSDEQTLMLSAYDVVGLLRFLYPASAGCKPSANPSTAGSSTLIPDSHYHDGIHKLNAPSVSDISGISTETPAGEAPISWDSYTQRGSKADIMDEPSLLNQKELSSRGLEHELVHVYNYLTSLMPPELPTTIDLHTIEWTFFTTDAEGKALLPHAERTGAKHRHLARDEQDFMARDAKNPANELRACIIQMLSQKDLGSGAFHSLIQSTEKQRKEVNSVLNNLIHAAIDQATVEYDYQGMRYWWQMQKLLQDSKGHADSLLRSISDDCQESIRAHGNISKTIEKQHYNLSSLRRVQAEKLQSELQRRQALRVKMWYASDVRHSSTFEDALHVTQALRAMANTPRSKQASGVAHWARQRLKNVSWQDRSVVQTVEALTEPNEYSGTSKLNEEQVERTSRWLTRQSIENFCRGEERIQRFCFEIQKCVNKLTGSTLLESPVLWSSRLFEQERRSFDRKPQGSHGEPFHDPIRNISTPLNQCSHTYRRQAHQGDQNAMANTAKSDHISKDFSPKEPVRSIPLYMSQNPVPLPGSSWLCHLPDFASRQQSLTDKVDSAKAIFTAKLKRDLYSLMLSDLGSLIWHSGTETDTWVKLISLDDNIAFSDHQHLHLEVAGKVNDERETDSSQALSSVRDGLHLLLTAATGALQDPRSRWHTHSDRDTMTITDKVAATSDQQRAPSFPYRQSYKGILHKFSMSQDPHYKLRRLEELEQLVSHSIQDLMLLSSVKRSWSYSHPIASLSRSQSLLVPRTKATSFEEIIANCTERRAGTMRYSKLPPTPSLIPENETFGTDEVVNELLSIFRDLDLRPSTLFRDLQYIAAFVPAEILDQTLQGKAFWDAGLAALALKQELCDSMVTRATDITNYHISVSTPSPDPPPMPLHSKSLANTTLQDAAQLWIIAAKEGSTTAARELGLLYLTHPEILPRTTLQPFSKPKEVFRMVGARKEGSTTSEEGKLDPVTFAVVFHWMEVAANGGDRDARDFLRGNGEWSTGR